MPHVDKGVCEKDLSAGQVPAGKVFLTDAFFIPPGFLPGEYGYTYKGFKLRRWKHVAKRRRSEDTVRMRDFRYFFKGRDAGERRRDRGIHPCHARPE